MNYYFTMATASLGSLGRCVMPIVLYSVHEARDWLESQGRVITEKGLRKAMERGGLPYKLIGSLYVVCEDDLQAFLESPPRRGRPKKVDKIEQ